MHSASKLNEGGRIMADRYFRFRLCDRLSNSVLVIECLSIDLAQHED